jgi:cell division protein FtsN
MEGKKVLWVVFSIALALVVVLAAGLFLLRPRQPKSPEASATAAPSLQGYDPYEYVRGTSVPPGLTPPPSGSQPTVIVVGEPPAGAAPLTPAIEPMSFPGEAPPAAAGQPSMPPERIAGAPTATAAPAQAAEKLAPAAQPPPERAPPERAGAGAGAAAAKASQKKAVAASAPRPKAVSVTEYWIQAGSFSSYSRADEVTRRLEERGLAARTTTRDLNGKTHFRVRVGPYTSKAEAEKFLGWIRELKGFETSYISMVASRRTMP